MNTEGNANSRSRTGSSPNTRGESSRRPRQFETKGESATPAPPVRNTFKPEADWQPTRKRAEELFGASRSVLPVDSDLMANAGQMSEKVAVKWDGGKGEHKPTILPNRASRLTLYHFAFPSQPTSSSRNRPRRLHHLLTFKPSHLGSCLRIGSI